MEKRVALVTGGNRGLGFETCRQLLEKNYRVVLASRDLKKGETAAQKLGSKDLTLIELDVTNEKQITNVVQNLAKTFQRLDALVNNAGVLPGNFPRRPAPAMEEKSEDILAAFRTNTLGALLLCQAVIPLMKKNGYGRIVNVSSGMGQLDEMQGGYAAYRISKTALNAVTKIFAAETAGDNILVNSVCPGWVKTDMGGASAEREPAEGADTILWLATLPDKSPSGGFFRDRALIPW